MRLMQYLTIALFFATAAIALLHRSYLMSGFWFGMAITTLCRTLNEEADLEDEESDR